MMVMLFMAMLALLQVVEHDGCAAYKAAGNSGNVTILLQDTDSTHLAVSHDEPHA